METGPNPLDDRRVQLLDSVPASVAVIDADGVIRAVNSRWRQYAADNWGYDAERNIGMSYVSWTTSSSANARASSLGVLDVIEGRSKEFAFVYPCHNQNELQWFEFLVVPLTTRPPRPVLAFHVQVDPLFQADGSLWGMAGAILQDLGIETI